MQTFGKWLGRVLLAVFLLFLGAWLIVPSDKVDTEISFKESDLSHNLDEYLQEVEAQFPDIVPGTEKRIIWAGSPGVKTDLAVVYLHGFSATSEEIRPVPDNVAKAFGANLFFTRLTGHGRTSAAMGEVSAGDWLEDAAEALAIGRRLGREVLVISTSTGGTLAAISATDAGQIFGVKGIVFVSPNFALKHWGAMLMRLPLARYWLPLLVGREIGFEPENEAHGKYWTTRYPSVSAFPLGSLLRYANGLDYSGVTTPALFIFSDKDQVVSPKATRRMIERWGGTVAVVPMTPEEGDDPNAHVIAGDIVSPGGTGPATNAIINWVNGL